MHLTVVVILFAIELWFLSSCHVLQLVFVDLFMCLPVYCLFLPVDWEVHDGRDHFCFLHDWGFGIG